MTAADPSPDRLNLWPQHCASLRLAGNSPNTIRARAHALAYVTRLAGIDLADLTVADLRGFLGRPGLSAATRHTYASHFASFYRWCVVEGLLDRDPTLRLPKVIVRQGLPRPMGRDDLQRALDGAPRKVRAWLMLGAYAGLRCAEAAALHADNVRPPVLIITGKGGKTRAVPIHPELAVELATWPDDGYLFPGTIDGHVSARYVSEAVNAHLRGLGIAATAHAARHRFGTDVYRVERDLRATQTLLGHSNPQTTMVYTEVDQPALERMVAALYGEATTA